MAGTYITGEEKVRPGTYFNIQTPGNNQAIGAIDGIVAILFRANWGPLGEAIEISCDGYEKVFGTEITTDAIAQAFEGGANTAICCRVGTGGTSGNVKLKISGGKDDAITITSKYVGAKAFTVTVKDKLSDDSKRECIIYSGTKEFEKLTFSKGTDEVSSLVEAFAESKNFKATKVGTASGLLAAVSQATFTLGTNPTIMAEDYSNALAAIEKYRYNTICVDTEDVAIHALLGAFVERIYNAGQLTQAVIAERKSTLLENRMAHALAYNNEKIVYVLNASATSSTFGELEGYQVAARVAGMIAAYPSNNSLTHAVLAGVTQLNEALTPTQMTKAETMGCLVLSVNTGKQVWIDSAINTLVTPDENQDNGWKKIRRTKTRYELITRSNNQSESLIGKVDNDANGRATIVSQIQGIGNAMVEEGKLVSCSVSENTANIAEGDSAWFNIECIDKDSAERIYLTYKFRFTTQEG